MTWGEFKAEVERQGATDDMTINVIDISGVFEPGYKLQVTLHDDQMGLDGIVIFEG